MKAIDIMNVIENHYPLSLQEEWDKCGLQIGNKQQDIHKVMISLDADNDSLQEAIDQGCQMLITHHPFLLEPIENIDYESYMGQFIVKAIKNDIVVYSSHTALDRVSMNKWLLEALDVVDIHSGKDGITHYGQLKQPMSVDDFIQHISSCLDIEHLKYAGTGSMIRHIAICGGSGADFIEQYYNKVDAYITGDTKYRHAKAANDHHMLLVDINHHAESIMVDRLRRLLEKELDVEIIMGTSPDYYTYM